jgi:hypothetical protein
MDRGINGIYPFQHRGRNRTSIYGAGYGVDLVRLHYNHPSLPQYIFHPLLYLIVLLRGVKDMDLWEFVRMTEGGLSLLDASRKFKFRVITL